MRIWQEYCKLFCYIYTNGHDDFIYRNVFRITEPLWGHIGLVLRNFYAFLLFAWTNCCRNHWYAGDSRNHSAHTYHTMKCIKYQINWNRRCTHQYVGHITMEINNHTENNSIYIDEILVESWLWLQIVNMIMFLLCNIIVIVLPENAFWV